jgi:2-keto-3-deoxy-L-fuconate dehydrogenase
MFALEGATVYATDTNEIEISKLSVNEGIITLKLDVTDENSIKSVLSQISKIDILFNCAGYVHSGSILDCSENDWDFAFDLNVKGMYRVTKLALPIMLNNDGGSIINMSSVASSIKGVVNRFAYSTSKAAIIGFTKSIATDFINQNIRCNAICPGTVDTPSLHERLKVTGNYKQAMSDFIARQPMGRIGKAEEIANLATYLASDSSKFTTGQAHIIDGGWAI